MKTQSGGIFSQPCGGYSAVFAPDGRRLSRPVPPTEEGMVYAELDLDFIVACRHFIDPIGHFSRPDLLWLGVDAREKKHVRHIKGEEGQEPLQDMDI